VPVLGLREAAEVTLHPCPYCSSPVEVIDLGGGHVCIGCETCGMGGPTARNYDVELARRAWEILCSRMCSHCRKNLIRHFTGRIRELKTEIALLKREAPPEVGSGGAEE
jgi:hypothetical protein